MAVKCSVSRNSFNCRSKNSISVERSNGLDLYVSTRDRVILGEAVFLKLNIYCVCSYLIKLKRNKDVCTLTEESLSEKVYSKYKRLKFTMIEKREYIVEGSRTSNWGVHTCI